MPMSKWRTKAKRPSCLDLMQVLRKKFAENKNIFGLETHVT